MRVEEDKAIDKVMHRLREKKGTEAKVGNKKQQSSEDRQKVSGKTLLQDKPVVARATSKAGKAETVAKARTATKSDAATAHLQEEEDAKVASSSLVAQHDTKSVKSSSQTKPLSSESNVNAR